ncbi:MAG TPA: hypothetical protein VK668_23385 [Mucilaginibacter sp.]|nr:hypothetical protein [Mucilaginibacter sp.]
MLISFASYGKDFNPVTHSKHLQKPHFTASTRNNSNDSNYTLIINPVESIPIINIQLHKIVNPVQAIFTELPDFAVCLKCYNFFSGSGNNQSAISKKSLLFPFHTFW